jgi:hypothetical protein
MRIHLPGHRRQTTTCVRPWTASPDPEKEAFFSPLRIPNDPGLINIISAGRGSVGDGSVVRPYSERSSAVAVGATADRTIEEQWIEHGGALLPGSPADGWMERWIEIE